MMLRRLSFRLKHIIVLVWHMQWREILRKVRNRIYSSTEYHGLLRDLSQPISAIETLLPTRIRALDSEYLPLLFNIHAPGLSSLEVTDRLYRQALFTAGLRSPYVAVTREGRPCAAMWLIPASENRNLAEVSNGAFPVLRDDEMLLEGLFTLNEFRHKRIMLASVTEALSIAKVAGARTVLSFVEHENLASLRCLRRAGFNDHLVKRESWFLFKRTLTFSPILELGGAPAEAPEHAGGRSADTVLRPAARV